ncbi:MAG: PQQ-dependent sugar dehydrogenase [Planctomycetales bacterium]|nr:PQQ-dependent sugar dehydrogenase [Planctomycetales bacterium]
MLRHASHTSSLTILPLLCLASQLSVFAQQEHGIAPVPSVVLELNVKDESADGIECFRITTPTATYLLDKLGAGLSSMLDSQGHDWISFSPLPGSGSAGEYRGFPNAVFKEQGSYFHPRNVSTDSALMIVESATTERVVISATASNGQWAGVYTFTASACTFTLTKKPADHNYWVLYEGTPGGSLDTDDWWISSGSAIKSLVNTKHEGDLRGDSGVEWIAFGDKQLDRVLALIHHEDDELPDRYYPMESNMTVFGFGRNGMQKHLESVPQSFSIAFIDTSDSAQIPVRIGTLAADASNTSNQAAELMGITQRRKALEQYALTQPGDAPRGKQLFASERTKCSTCHVVQGEGGAVGPDLSVIGGKFDRPHLIESLLSPSQQIVEGYRTQLILTRDGIVHSGIVRSEVDGSLKLVDAYNREISLATTDIEQRTIANVSLMPQGLLDPLSPQEFTDLVAYLETLQSGNAKFGSGLAGPVTLPAGFEISTVATGLSGVTAMEVAADGRVFICEQNGSLRVVKDGILLDQPFVALDVEHNWERGLIGVTLDPAFPDTPWVYVVYVTDQPYSHHRVSRFAAVGDVAVAGSEKILLVGDDQKLFGGNVPAGHQGGGIHFGRDGKIYVGLGEQTAGVPAQSFNALQGKILRINADGSIPRDNPFMGRTNGKYQSIWAIGCRNPFTFAVRKTTGEMFINDVGGKFEEVNLGIAGANYGWPDIEHGTPGTDAVTGPIHQYPQASISGGDFSDTAVDWPSAYRGKYFFADFVHGWIKMLDPLAPERAIDFAQGIRRPVDLRFARDGSLYVLVRNAWVVDQKFEENTGSLLRISYHQ